LALVFDDPVALSSLSHQAIDTALPDAVRQRAIAALIGRRPSDLAPLLLKLVDDPAVCQVALRGLASYNHPQTVATILARYDSLAGDARQQALQTLASRPQWAAQLLDSVQSHRISPRDLTAYTARQIQNLGSAELARRVTELWGEVRASSGERRREAQRLRQQLTAAELSRADVTAGRMVFQKQCGTCHRFFNSGGQIGPDLTGSPRTNLDYLLENIIDPSAAVARDFRMQVIETTDGRVVTGLVESESQRAVTLLTVNERIVVPTEEIEQRSESQVSMMPDGLLQSLTPDEIRNLFAYLQSDLHP
jgi:putative heme-binding domain-containing protein